MKLSACIEMLFVDASEDFAERIHMAKSAGLDAIEFWRWSNKNLNAIEDALHATNMPVGAIVAEPMIAITDPANRDAFLEGLQRSVAVAQRLGTKVLIAQAGNDLEGVDREDQHRALVGTLEACGDVLAGTGIRLGLEPLNTLIDHPGYYLSSTREGLNIIDEVARPEIGITYDLYHSYVMGEAIEDVLDGRVAHVVHAHVADHPGRNEPGTGEINLGARLSWLLKNGYEGFIGLEYRPVGSTLDRLEIVRNELAKEN